MSSQIKRIKRGTHEDPVKLLTENRDRLLEQIARSEANSQKDAVSTVHAKSDYNRLCDTLDALNRKIGPNFLARLPREVWIRIIEAAMMGVGDFMSSPIEILLALTLVCDSLRDLIINTPGLWTEIVVGRGLGEEDALAKLATSLHLSKKLPIHLTIRVRTRDWDVTLGILYPHEERIRGIYLEHVTSEPWDSSGVAKSKTSQELSYIISSFDQLPGLRYLYTNGRSHSNALAGSWPSLLQKTSSLVAIVGFDLPEQYMSHQSMKSLRIMQAVDKIIDIVAHLKMLEGLELLDLYPHYRYRSLLTEHPRYGIKKLGLRHLRYGHQFDLEALALISLCSSLTRLQVLFNTSLVHFDALTNTIGLLPHLRTLVLEIGPDCQDVETLKRECAPLRQVRELSITCTFKDHQKIIRAQLIDKIGRRFTHVEGLTLLSWCYMPASRALTCSLKHLRHLTISSDDTDDLTQIASIESPTLEALHLIGGPKTVYGLLRNAQVPRLSHLAVVLGLSRSLFPFTGILLPTIFRCLVSLKVHPTRSYWQIGNLPVLRTVQFHEKAFQECEHNLTEFFVGLIHSPEICPLLEELDFRFIPPWDLLILMLERRNLLPSSSNVSPIKAVTLLPYLPPSTILRPLVDLLNNRFTSLPCPLQMSMHAVIDAYFDASIPGCDHCVLSFQTCNQKTISSSFYHDSGAIWSAEEPSYGMEGLPTHISQWLQGRLERRSEWLRCEDLQWAQKWSRILRCAKYGPSAPIKVTGLFMSELVSLL